MVLGGSGAVDTITDIFARRYENVLHFGEYDANRWLRPLFMQAAHIFFGDVQSALRLPDVFYDSIHERLARELGLPALSFEQKTSHDVCAAYLVTPYDLWNEAHRDPDYFVKTRLSLLELLLRGAEESVNKLHTAAPAAHRGLFGWLSNSSAAPLAASSPRLAIAKAIEELNARFQASKLRLTYHNGFLQLASDELTSAQVTKPFLGNRRRSDLGYGRPRNERGLRPS